jgi:hypothetical protein
MTQADLIWSIVGFLLTVMIFSYIFGDNPLFRLAAYLFVGVTAGFVTITVITQVLVPQLWLPLVSGSLTGRLIALVPLALSLVLLLKIFPPFARFGNIPMAYLVGAGAAILIGGAVLGTLFPQIIGTVNLFDLGTAANNQISPVIQFVNALLVLAGAATALFFFYFGAKTSPNQPPRRNPLVEGLARVGQVFIGITLGALFAGVYSSALTALIERISSVWNLVHLLFGS